MESWIEQLVAVGHVGIAAGLGGLVGFEREMARKPAGMRTHMLVCAAACAFMLLGLHVLGVYGPEQAMSNVRADPVRIMQAIVVGVSFLGAGTIIHRGGHDIEGLTTAGSILLVTVVGIAVALERYVFAGAVAAAQPLVVFCLWPVERWARKRWGKPHDGTTPFDDAED